MKPEIYTTIGTILHKKCCGKDSCGEIKVAEGNFHKFKRSGSLHYSSICKLCYRAYQRRRHQDCYAIEPYGDLVQRVTWPATGRLVVTGMFGNA
jgi:hypothetical protein